MAGCGQVYRIDPRIDSATCNALTSSDSGLLVPRVEVVEGIGIEVRHTPGCPEQYTVEYDGSYMNHPATTATVSLTGADRTWQMLSEFGTSTIVRPGVYHLTAQVRSVRANTTTAAIGSYVTAGLTLNGTVMPGTESLWGGRLEAGDTEQNTVPIVFLNTLSAGDVIGLAAYRIGQSGTHSVVSNADGRSRVVASWIARVGDDLA